MCLPGPVTLITTITMRLPSNSGFVDSYCIGGLSPGMACFHQGRYPVSLLSGKLRVCAHLCLSFQSERKVMMLTRLALYSELMSCTYKLNPGPFSICKFKCNVELST
uniref:Uncharacterized protein n=1 Tax=Candidatus Kentrum eta TaxID=2126337 RepID=A0A450VQL3_9GAMM|nr:MAG: hypothetical protein BECKH772B_GA0070898_107421 [Candidatus Kentron sp. H]VFK08106.1 MAG: hypothetical protein BECKH772A_GA0070896_108191 [Candidatus Kentron sp. H]VFK11629.1 MAG: hypothetical protein BECKH772C_GA0070978_108481 [Candidatus Kentron sp. H]